MKAGKLAFCVRANANEIDPDKDSTWPSQNQNWERWRPAKSATDEELQPELFKPNLESFG
jgi:hypothetical protein